VGAEPKKLLTPYLEASKINLVKANGFQLNILHFVNKNAIEAVYHILFNLFDLRFHQGNILMSEFYDLYPLDECVFLSEREKAENYPLFYEMLAERPAPPPQTYLPSRNQESRKNKSGVRHYGKKETTKQIQRYTTEEKQTDPIPSSAAPENIAEAPEASPFETILQSASTIAPVLPLESDIVLSQEIDNPDPRQECKMWLQEVLEKASSKEREYFSIFHKARSLLKELETIPEWMLLNIQQATSTLAVRLQNLEPQTKPHIQHSNRIIVPNASNA